MHLDRLVAIKILPADKGPTVTAAVSSIFLAYKPAVNLGDYLGIA